MWHHQLTCVNNITNTERKSCKLGSSLPQMLAQKAHKYQADSRLGWGDFTHRYFLLMRKLAFSKLRSLSPLFWWEEKKSISKHQFAQSSMTMAGLTPNKHNNSCFSCHFIHIHYQTALTIQASFICQLNHLIPFFM